MGNNIFEEIKKVNEYEQEFWSARDLYRILGYTEYGKFLPTIDRAKESCKKKFYLGKNKNFLTMKILVGEEGGLIRALGVL